MAVEFVPYEKAFVTRRWAWLLYQCERRGWRGSLDGPRSGARTYAQQLALWLLWRAGKGAPAFSPNGPSRHLRKNIIRIGGWAQAVDVSDPEGLIAAAAGLGIKLHRPYAGEPWHVEAVRLFNIKPVARLGMGRGLTPQQIHDAHLVAVMHAHGIVYPNITLRIARASKLRITHACALLQKESGGGTNEFGHDPVRSPQIVGGPVTRTRYRQYKKLRPTHGMQGVGPSQLTWSGFQDMADAHGGCWYVPANMLVGFSHLRDLINKYGEHDGAAAYNGTGPRAQAYGKDFVVKVRRWEKLFG